jgi:hypothetical protein
MIPLLLLHISLALPQAGLTADVRRTAIAEIAAIWSAHGVVVAADSGRLPSADAVLLQVVVEARPPALGPPSGGPLASVTFDEDGMPVPVIRLYLASLGEMIARANIPGAGGDASPAVLRERAIGRAVGRVLAHELGHFLLRSRWHAKSGLMRPVHTAADLVGHERTRFALSPPEDARIAAVASNDALLSSAVECVASR